MSVAVSDINEGIEPSELDRASSVSAATRTIQTLFGADFGSCWGDFYCSHGRIRGRLFVVTNGILFFSSLLGFERRLCLQFADISALVLHRTTSIRIEIADYDTYIFRSFHDREKVLQLLIRLKRLVEKKRIRGHTTVGRSEYREGDNAASWDIQQIEYENCNRSFEHNPKSSLSFPALHTSFSSSNINRSIDDTGPQPNRRRAASDSIVQPNSTQTNHFILENENRDTNSVHSSVSTIQESWEETTQTLAGKKEIGIEVITSVLSIIVLHICSTDVAFLSR
jgi:hypothetical protein